MLRSQVVRITSRNSSMVAVRASPSRVSARRYATTPADVKPQGTNNTLLYTALGVAAIGGAYVYFKKNPSEEEALKQKARADEEDMKQKARESASAARSRVGDAVQEGRLKYDEAKDTTKKRFDETRSGVDQKADEAMARGRGVIDDVKERSGALARDAEAKYDSAKNALKRTGDSTEHLYDEARDTTKQRAREAQAELDRAGQETKQGWFSWLGWGRSKADEGGARLKRGEKDIEQRLDKDKQSVAQKVADGAEGVRNRAEKHS